MTQKNLLNSAFIVLMVGLSRFIPHWPNFTAIGASAIWMAYAWPQQGSPSIFSKSIFIPLTALFLTDWIIGFHNQMLWVYGALLLNGFIFQKRAVSTQPNSILGSALISSILFFLITNFGVWLSMNFYPHTTQGLMACFTAALPFAATDFAGTLFYTCVGLFVLQKVQYFSKKQLCPVSK